MIFSTQNCKCSHMYLCITVECLSGSQCVFKKCQTIWSMEAINFSCGRLMHLTALVYFLPTLWITIGLICQWNVLNGFYFLLLCLSLEANAFNPFSIFSFYITVVLVQWNRNYFAFFLLYGLAIHFSM